MDIFTFRFGEANKVEGIAGLFHIRKKWLKTYHLM